VAKYNIDRIRQLVGEINSALAKLGQTRQVPEKEFLSSPEKIDSAKYNLIVAIEAAIDICGHLAARAGGRTPSDYADCFKVLAELKMLSEELSERLQKMARFRNLLVHVYWQIDNQKVYQIIRKDIQDIKKYLKEIDKHIS
jgi:uncharacterized protein YutE (UPF0331/DUF86 family)